MSKLYDRCCGRLRPPRKRLRSGRACRKAVQSSTRTGLLRMVICVHDKGSSGGVGDPGGSVVAMRAEAVTAGAAEGGPSGPFSGGVVQARSAGLADRAGRYGVHEGRRGCFLTAMGPHAGAAQKTRVWRQVTERGLCGKGLVARPPAGDFRARRRKLSASPPAVSQSPGR